jgi:hypothetical protein
MACTIQEAHSSYEGELNVCGEVLLTFFSAGSWTVSASLLRAFRICEAATLVDVFSKA